MQFKKIGLQIIFLVGSTILCLPFLANSAQAFTLKNGEEETTVPKNTLTSWQGSFSVPAQQYSVTFQVKPITTLINNFAGIKNISKDGYVNFKYDPAKIYSYVKKLEVQVNQTAADPNLKIEDGKVINFTPPTQGKNLDTYSSTLKIIKALQDNDDSTELVIKTITPNKKLSDTNDLGINELIAEGVSNFSGSPSNRRHNIKVGVEKMRGVIVKPGEEFSFNKYLGPVEAEQGYLPELVIRADKGTVPELGGGLCQVSSTVFRAAMKAGLPITQRRNHAYAVKYYAPQGTDATIYPGVIDLKFINDTPASILIWPTLKSNDYLYFDFYGTKDDREVNLGTPYQFDKKPDGSMKATWERSVTKNGKTKSETFSSNYKPPALFHKQEEFVPATPPPGSIPATTTDPSPTTPNSNTQNQTTPTPPAQSN